MTDEEINLLAGDELEVAYAEQVLGYVYKPGKTERKPWYRRGYPDLAVLPHFLGWDYVFDRVRLLHQEGHPFLDRYAAECFHVQVTFHPDYGSVMISLSSRKQAESPVIKNWHAKGIHIGEAFLRAMLKAAEWFRRERSWVPK